MLSKNSDNYFVTQARRLKVILIIEFLCEYFIQGRNIRTWEKYMP